MQKNFHLYTPPPPLSAATATRLPSAAIPRKPLRPQDLQGIFNYFHLL